MLQLYIIIIIIYNSGTIYENNNNNNNNIIIIIIIIISILPVSVVLSTGEVVVDATVAGPAVAVVDLWSVCRWILCRCNNAARRRENSDYARAGRCADDFRAKPSGFLFHVS